MGVIHGILLIGIIGRVLMHGGGGGRSRRSKDGGAQIALLGLALFAIGYLGTLFGNLIKAAVSRQREFLADASAVQFTRNPEGISHALAKIGGLTQGSRMASSLAAEASHMFFGDGMVHRISSVMATHPPLPERILRVDPSFGGRFEAVAEDFIAPPDADEARLGVLALAGAAGLAPVRAGVGKAMPGQTEATASRAVRPDRRVSIASGALGRSTWRGHVRCGSPLPNPCGLRRTTRTARSPWRVHFFSLPPVRSESARSRSYVRPTQKPACG